MLNAVRHPFLPDHGLEPALENTAFLVYELLFDDDLLRNRHKQKASELSLADTDRCLSILQNRLVEKTCQKMPLRRGVRVARGVAPAVAALLLDRVTTELEGADFPIGEGRQRRVESAIELACELGDVFRDVANTAASGRLGDPVLAEAVTEGLSCLSQALLISVLARQDMPQGFWQSVHLLYARALEGDVSGAHGIHRAYVRTLLLALSGSNNLSQRDIVRLYKALDRWSTRVRLFDKRRSSGTDGGVFAVRLWSDVPPVPVDRARHLIRGTARLGSPLWWLVWIDVRPLLNWMETAGCESGLSVEVLSHLRWRWSGARRPRATRLSLNMDVEIAVGFDGMRGALRADARGKR